MEPVRRKRYLKALGLDTWRLRAESPSPAVAERGEAAAVTAAAHVRAVMASAAPAPVVREVPADWAGLRAMVRDCQACKLCATRTQTVFGVGPENAPLMIVGEGPGADEDAQGEPFVGRAGKLLDEMLRSIGRSRHENVFIANVVKCRPPGNRDPEADEVEACRPYLDRQIELVKPRLIVALGRVAAQRLLGTDLPLSRLRGPMYRYGPQQTPVFVTYHPAYLLRSPREKAKSWEDLKQIHRYMATVS
ncbi:DNA polymerase [Fontimonas thermophila]|uniref:Type-4 uracil-DNA glycosylase n=1 Tax=Fontimonas thermophila TaxID=1076937 RepID=A0A1I2IUA9_9GAMM|nr:uracil-DNA glycosylase [Fontimonas thermophila]SFF44346.1 DNA polymerase [Fontimonas thermophila]